MAATAVVAGAMALASIAGSVSAKKQKRKELEAAQRMHQEEMGQQARMFAVEKESEGSNREASALNNVIEGLRKSHRR